MSCQLDFLVPFPAFRVGGVYNGQAGPALLQSQGERLEKDYP
jgi:hypothetical protein